MGDVVVGIVILKAASSSNNIKIKKTAVEVYEEACITFVIVLLFLSYRYNFTLIS